MPSVSPDGTKVLFVSDRKWEPDNKLDDTYDIYVMDVDGGNVRNLTGNQKWDSMPSWSPDGSMIVFMSMRGGWQQMWVTDVNGENFLCLTPNRNLRMWDFPIWPAWSPDGSRIIYTSGTDAKYDLFYFHIDYDLVKQIVTNPTTDNYAGEEWTPTGNRKVVRAALNPQNYNTPWLTGVGKLTTQQSSYAGKACYSPNGGTVVYEADRRIVNTEYYDIYRIDSDGGSPVNLTNSVSTESRGQFNDWPSWSPDGRKIVFVSDREGKWQIYTMNADGTKIERIINNNFADFSPHWGSVPYGWAEKIKVLLPRR